MTTITSNLVGAKRIAAMACTMILYFVASKSAPSENASGLDHVIPALSCKGITLVSVLDVLGNEAGLKFAIEDRRVSHGGKIVRELASMQLGDDLPESSCRDRLDKLAARMSFRWLVDGDIIWIVNMNCSRSSPLLTKVYNIKYQGHIGGLGPILNKIDNRIPDFYIFNNITEGWTRFRVELSTTNCSIRHVFSKALEQFPATGALLEFYELAPSDLQVGPITDRTTQFMWQLLKNPSG